MPKRFPFVIPRVSRAQGHSTLSIILAATIFVSIAGAATVAWAVDPLITQCTTQCSADECKPGDIPSNAMAQCRGGCHDRCAKAFSDGVLRPKYHIMTILYAPPGCTNTSSYRCTGNGLVDYQSGSSTGTKVSTQQSFKDGMDVSVGGDFSLFGMIKFGAEANSGFSSTYTDTFSETISKAKSLGIKLQGNGDGIDHGQDQIILLLNPAIAWAKLENKIRWNLGASGNSTQLYTLYVSWLKNPGSMPPNVAAELTQRGLTNDDYRTILTQNPFADGSTTIDPQRFVPTTWTLPYEPPSGCGAAGCTCASFSSAIKNDLQLEVSSQQQTQYTVGLKESAGALGTSLKASESFTWTNSRTVANITSSTNTASATITCPSPNYNGPTLMAVYWDTLYGSFLFEPVTADFGLVIHRGRVTDGSGRALRHQAVALSIGDKKFHTVTNRNGEFKIYFAEKQLTGLSMQKGLLSVRGRRMAVDVGASTTSAISIK
jgi:hypothetical protein